MPRSVSRSRSKNHDWRSPSRSGSDRSRHNSGSDRSRHSSEEKPQKKKKERFRREESSIFHRQNQVLKKPLIIYAYDMGKGSEELCKKFEFTARQLKDEVKFGRGGDSDILEDSRLDMIIATLAHRFGRSHKGKIYTIDGLRMSSFVELINKGAYVFAERKQKWRHTWYHLPRNAIDTSSNDSEEERERERERE